jgi:hypothetical protein
LAVTTFAIDLVLFSHGAIYLPPPCLDQWVVLG